MVNRTACANNNNFTALKLDNYVYLVQKMNLEGTLAVEL